MASEEAKKLALRFNVEVTGASLRGTEEAELAEWFEAFREKIVERERERAAGIILEVGGDNGTTERVLAAIRSADHG